MSFNADELQNLSLMIAGTSYCACSSLVSVVDANVVHLRCLIMTKCTTCIRRQLQNFLDRFGTPYGGKNRYMLRADRITPESLLRFLSGGATYSLANSFASIHELLGSRHLWENPWGLDRFINTCPAHGTSKMHERDLAIPILSG